VTVAGRRVAAGQIAWSEPAPGAAASAIAQAFRDFHSGRFGDIPGQARLQYR
jgi:hypothetical protein